MSKWIIRKIRISFMLLGIILILCACGEEKESCQEKNAGQEDVGDTQTEDREEKDKIGNTEMEYQVVDENAEVESTVKDEGKQVSDDSNGEGKAIPEGARELLEYVFDYLYEDQSDMVDIELYETEEELYYKWKIRYSSGETSNPCVLEYFSSTKDGLYQIFATYAEVWEIDYDKDGIEHKEHIRNSYGDFLLVNTENLKVISRWLLNEDENAEYDYIENEEYLEIIRSYAEQNEDATPVPVVKGDIPERSYKSHREFPYENMEFVDDEAFAFLREAYEAIDFYGEFETGDEELYDDYIKKYRKLVDNEIPFTEREEEKEYYLSEYGNLGAYGDDEYDPHEFTYYLFDMDGDNMPELCIWNYATYVFKYDTASDSMILWNSFVSPNEFIHGTKMVRWIWDGVRYSIYRLDEDGEVIFGVYFLLEATWSNGNETYMLTVPSYNGKPIEIPQEIKEQAYFSEEDGWYYFKVTEEQYDQLTGDYFKAYEQSNEEIEKFSYSYDELFETGSSAILND